jgi:hypothetical protein
MAHQVNLFSPILLAPRRLFSASAMLRALGVLVLALALLGLALQWQGQRLAAELRATQRFGTDEQQRLGSLLADRRLMPTDTRALEQELAAEQQALAALRARRDAQLHGLVRDGRSPPALLRLVASTLPAPVWLSELRLADGRDGRLELAGQTLQPELLQPWLEVLAAHPLTAAQGLALVRVDRIAAGQTVVDSGSSGAAPARLPLGTDSWTFRIAGGEKPTGGARPLPAASPPAAAVSAAVSVAVGGSTVAAPVSPPPLLAQAAR